MEYVVIENDNTSSKRTIVPKFIDSSNAIKLEFKNGNSNIK